jgi:hypothetical protein
MPTVPRPAARIAAPVGSAMFSFLGISQAKDPLLFAAARGVTNSLVTQGLGSALGLQSFSWKAIAVSAITAPINTGINAALGDALGGLHDVARDGVLGTLNGVLAQAVRMQFYSDGKVDWSSIAADAFGNAIGNSIVSQANDPSAYSIAARDRDWEPGGSSASPVVGTPSAATYYDDFDNNFRLPGRNVASEAPDLNPTSAVRSLRTGRDGINSVSAAFVAAYGRPPTPLEAIRFANYNNLTSAHSVGTDRELIAPELEVLSRQAVSEDQYRDYMAKAQGFEIAKETAAARAVMIGSYRAAEIRHTESVLTAMNTAAGAVGSVADSVTPSQLDLELGRAEVGAAFLDPAGGERFLREAPINFVKGVAQGALGLAGDAVKGLVMAGDLVFNDGRNIHRIDQFNVRPFDYDPGLGQAAGIAGEFISPTAWIKAVQYGAKGLAALGPTLDNVLSAHSIRAGLQFNAFDTATVARASPGTVTGGSGLPVIEGRWLKGSHGNFGNVPGQLVEQLDVKFQ